MTSKYPVHKIIANHSCFNLFKPSKKLVKTGDLFGSSLFNYALEKHEITSREEENILTEQTFFIIHVPAQ